MPARCECTVPWFFEANNARNGRLFVGEHGNIIIVRRRCRRRWRRRQRDIVLGVVRQQQRNSFRIGDGGASSVRVLNGGVRIGALLEQLVRRFAPPRFQQAGNHRPIDRRNGHNGTATKCANKHIAEQATKETSQLKENGSIEIKRRYGNVRLVATTLHFALSYVDRYHCDDERYENWKINRHEENPSLRRTRRLWNTHVQPIDHTQTCSANRSMAPVVFDFVGKQERHRLTAQITMSSHLLNAKSRSKLAGKAAIK